MAFISSADRAYAEDMGHSICEDCGTYYYPLIELAYEGHECPRMHGPNLTDLWKNPLHDWYY